MEEKYRSKLWGRDLCSNLDYSKQLICVEMENGVETIECTGHDWWHKMANKSTTE